MTHGEQAGQTPGRKALPTSDVISPPEVSRKAVQSRAARCAVSSGSVRHNVAASGPRECSTVRGARPRRAAYWAGPSGSMRDPPDMSSGARWEAAARRSARMRSRSRTGSPARSRPPRTGRPDGQGHARWPRTRPCRDSRVGHLPRGALTPAREPICRAAGSAPHPASGPEHHGSGALSVAQHDTAGLAGQPVLLFKHTTVLSLTSDRPHHATARGSRR